MSSPESSSPSPEPYVRFRPQRAMASFDNLVALANHQERLKEARKIIWRDKGEPATELTNLREVVDHAGRGGIRAATLAFCMRSMFNLVLALIRLRRVKPELRLTIIRRALIGEDSLRFAAMIGSFASIYKFILNALPILIPKDLKSRKTMFSLRSGTSTPWTPDIGSPNSALDLEPLASISTNNNSVPLSERTARLSLSAQAHQVWVRKKSSRWQTVLAGSIAGGISIMFEKKANRLGIVQQMFVRGLQGSYNAFTTKRGIHIPHGDVMVFSLCCAQIMYAFLMSPDTLPRSYINWIYQASQIPVDVAAINRGLVREGKFDVADLDVIMNRPDVSPNNMIQMLALRAVASAPTSDFGVRYSICPTVHPHSDSCATFIPWRFLDVVKWMMPVYGALHFIPMILFKRKLFMSKPLSMLLKASSGTARSSAFLGTFVIIYQMFFCSKHNIHTFLTNRAPNSFLRLPQSTIDLLITKASFWPGGALCGLALFVEERRRRGELAMYVLPKGLESFWVMARGHGLTFNAGKWGDSLFNAIAMGMVMSTYQNDPHHLSGLVRRVMYQFIGPN